MNAEKYYGKKITEVQFDEDTIILKFEDGSGFRIVDNGQSCCENRYMRTDDKPKDLIGSRLKEVRLADSRSTKDNYGDVHEIQFLIIKAGYEEISFSSHNVHNGYYGGFYIQLENL